MQFKFLNLEFKPSLLGTLLVLVSIPVFIKLGFWQYNKAIHKQAIQNDYIQSVAKDVADISEHINAPERLIYQKVKVLGEYVPEYQIMIDNQVENSLAGFHVLTPLKISGTNKYILVNRGWLAGKDNHMEVPTFETPKGPQQIEGMVWLPTQKIFTLEGKDQESSSDGKWKLVWQHLDMLKYQKVAPIDVLSVIIKLDPDSAAGGFVRNWQMPTERIMTNLGYAYQWFGFALAAFAIYLYLSFNRIK